MAIAKNRIGVTLNFLQVHDESEKKLKEAELFINNNNFLDKNLILANNYQFQSDLYSHLADYDKAIFYIKKVVPEYQKIKDSHEKQTNITKGYGNIGLKYLDLNIDSAAYYFQKSLKQQKVIEIKNFNVANYLGLGEVYNKKRDYEQSVKYLKKAELYNEKVQDGIYMIAIYELMQDSYKKSRK